jgi:hypothetical protein
MRRENVSFNLTNRLEEHLLDSLTCPSYNPLRFSSLLFILSLLWIIKLLAVDALGKSCVSRSFFFLITLGGIAVDSVL